MERVLALGVPPARIVYANPVRCRKMLEFARAHGIDSLTADCATELHKIAAYHPGARYIQFTNIGFSLIHYEGEL